MKVLTIWHPFAPAIVVGLKKYETRAWPTHHRGLIAIHCAARKPCLQFKQLAERYGIDTNPPYGKVIVICKLLDCIAITDEFMATQPQSELDFGDWRVGRYAWKLEIVKILEEPISAIGRQGLWNMEIQMDTDGTTAIL